MGMPARRFEFEEVPVEERLGRLELNVEHIQSDVSEMKVDIRHLNDKIDGVDQRLCAKIEGVDQKLSAKIDAVDQKFTAKFDSLKDQISGLALTMEKSNSQLRIWAMTFYISGAGALLTFLAHSLHWF
jgi:predicted RNase H-like nuclease (RuvC/YqgF family)